MVSSVKQIRRKASIRARKRNTDGLDAKHLSKMKTAVMPTSVKLELPTF